MMNDEIKELLQEIATVIKAVSIPQIKSSLQAEFESSKPEKRLAYELLHKDISQQEIVEIVKKNIPNAGIAQKTVSNWCVEWERLGLAKKEKITGKSRESYVKSFSLKDYGIEVPKVKTQE